MSIQRIEGNALGVLSDTHGSLPAWRSALRLFRNTGVILHAGDVLCHEPRSPIPGDDVPSDLAGAIKDYEGKLLISRGNCDADADQAILDLPLQPYVIIKWNGRKIFMMHGDNFPFFRQTAFDLKTDLAIYGHTHVYSVVKEEGTVFLNPGSTAIPRGKDPASVAIVDKESIRVVTLAGRPLHVEEW